MALNDMTAEQALSRAGSAAALLDDFAPAASIAGLKGS
jgi:hypothetical protein